MVGPAWGSFVSDPDTDHDSDGCMDSDMEDLDDDNDGVPDSDDLCPKGILGWTSNYSNDFDLDGCRNTMHHLETHAIHDVYGDLPSEGFSDGAVASRASSTSTT